MVTSSKLYLSAQLLELKTVDNPLPNLQLQSFFRKSWRKKKPCCLRIRDSCEPTT